MLSKKTAEHFQHKVLWITGASSGIGRALVIALSEINCQLIISARSVDKLQETVNQCAHKNIDIINGDLSNKQVNQTIVEEIQNKYGRLDIAILNAGTCEYVDIDLFDSDLFKRQMDINFMGMVYGIEATLPLLKQSKSAQLIGMSSTAAYMGLPRSEAYGASKAAIRNLFSALRVSLQPYQISASVICPGFVKTELTAKNDFPMPAMITAEKSSANILKGIAQYKQEIHFPKRFSLIMKLIASLPNPILSWMLSKAVVRK